MTPKIQATEVEIELNYIKTKGSCDPQAIEWGDGPHSGRQRLLVDHTHAN